MCVSYGRQTHANYTLNLNRKNIPNAVGRKFSYEHAKDSRLCMIGKYAMRTQKYEENLKWKYLPMNTDRVRHFTCYVCSIILPNRKSAIII